MNAKQIHQEIKETNLNFMLLAQKIIRHDRERALTEFAVNEELADLVMGLSPAQLMKMSASNMMLCSFRLNEHAMLDMLSGYKKATELAAPVATNAKTKKVEMLAV